MSTKKIPRSRKPANKPANKPDWRRIRGAQPERALGAALGMALEAKEDLVRVLMNAGPQLGGTEGAAELPRLCKVLGYLDAVIGECETELPAKTIGEIRESVAAICEARS